MSTTQVAFLISCALPLVFGKIASHDIPATNEQTADKIEWTDYSPYWCTKYGRVKLSEEPVPKSKDCKKLCVKLNPDCKAAEWWAKAGGLCFECTKPLMKRPYRDPTDLAHPPHVYIRKQSRAHVDRCDPNPCEHGAACKNTESHAAYECTCRPGYRGVHCEFDINECAKQNGGCSHKCKNTDGSYVCSCPDPELNLAPDRHTCVAYGVSVECRQNDMSITLPKTLLLGLNREHVTLRDVSCVATETETHYTLTTTLTGCGTTATHRKGAVVYSNTVLEIPVADDTIITRVREIEIPFSCYYKNSGDATAVGVKPDTRKLVFDEDGKGNFTVTLDMFPSDKFVSAFTQSDYPVEVKLRQRLYFQASVKSKDKTLSVLTENCYATPSQDRNHAAKYYLVKNGCPVDDTTIMLKSPNVDLVRFETEAFKFIAEHPFVFIHCHIRICDAGDPNSRCAQGCVTGSRKRRDVSSDDKVYPLAQGPLTINSDAMEMAANRKSALNDMTLPAVLSMAVLSALCLVGMVWPSSKKTSQDIVYNPLLVTSDD